VALRLAATRALSALVLAGTAGGAAPNDQYFGLQWGIQQINADEAWSTSTGKRQVIAVVDSGVDLTHPDLKAKLVGGATFTGCAEQPNGCGNGDWESAPDAGPPSPHGTHVAGIAAAATGNKIGVAGVARDAKINMSLGAILGAQALVLTGLETAVKDANTPTYGFGIVDAQAAVQAP
jgi:serine protease